MAPGCNLKPFLGFAKIYVETVKNVKGKNKIYKIIVRHPDKAWLIGRLKY
jgi:hypothetical protein